MDKEEVKGLEEGFYWVFKGDFVLSSSPHNIRLCYISEHEGRLYAHYYSSEGIAIHQDLTLRYQRAHPEEVKSHIRDMRANASFFESKLSQLEKTTQQPLIAQSQPKLTTITPQKEEYFHIYEENPEVGFGDEHL